MTGQDLASAAQALVGSPFRLHGRNPATGLDCIGVLAAALQACGQHAPLPNGYVLRARALPVLDGIIAGCGLVSVEGPIAAGDVLMMRAGPCQFHLLIAARAGGFIHAHAGLRHVVHGGAAPDWPVIHHWRLAAGN